jgi:hypothetical protein
VTGYFKLSSIKQEVFMASKDELNGGGILGGLIGLAFSGGNPIAMLFGGFIGNAIANSEAEDKRKKLAVEQENDNRRRREQEEERRRSSRSNYDDDTDNSVCGECGTQGCHSHGY